MSDETEKVGEQSWFDKKLTHATTIEKHVIKKLCKSQLSSELLDEVLKSEATYEYSGCGYFLTFENKALPDQRIVCDKPDLMGEWNGIDSGFIVFLGQHELMLECHTWGAIDVPYNYREQEVKVSELKM